MIQNILGKHFLVSSWAPSSRSFWWNRCQKNGFPSEQIWSSWGRGKSHMGPDRGNMGGSKVAMFLSARNWQILRPVWAGALSWWSAHALASQRLRLLSRIDLTRRRRISRRFGSLFGLGVGIRNERCLEYRRTQWASFLLLTSTSLLSLALEIHNFSIHDSLHHDNAPSHTGLSICQFLAERNIATLEPPSHIPRSWPHVIFSSFPRSNLFWREPIFLTELKKIPENAFQECFESWKKRMHKCLRVEGDYFEELWLWYISIFFNKLFITTVSLLFGHTSYLRCRIAAIVLNFNRLGLVNVEVEIEFDIVSPKCYTLTAFFIRFACVGVTLTQEILFSFFLHFITLISAL